MTERFDVIVIGSGVAGKSIAMGLSSSGKQVAIVEEDLWGGTCPNRGCDPKKVLLSAVEAQDKVRQMKGKGATDELHINWPDLMAFKQTFTDPVPEQSRKALENSEVETLTGSAKFISKEAIQVGESVVKADQFIIATGARPRILDLPGSEHFLTSDDFLSLPDMPDTLTFVGGGYITFELASIANAAGAEVHVIQHNDKPLKAYNQDFVREVMNQLESKGVTFHLNTDVAEIKQTDHGYSLTDKQDFELTTDLVFAATGRIPNADTLNLEAAGVDYDKGGILVNQHLRTSNPSIYALGDVLSKKQPKLTPVSSFESSYLLDYLTEQTNQPIVYPTIPTIVFTSPKLAQIGVTAEEAEKHPDYYDVATTDTSEWFSYSRTNEAVSKVTVVTETKSGQLVGVSCLNNEADQLINYFSFLINRQIKAEELSSIMFAYPSIGSDLSSLYK